MKVFEVITETLSDSEILYNKQASASYQFQIFFIKIHDKLSLVSGVWNELPFSELTSNTIAPLSFPSRSITLRQMISVKEQDKWTYLFYKMVNAKKLYEATGVKTKPTAEYDWAFVYDRD